MTDIARTTITLTKYYWEKLEKLVDKFAPTRAQVMSKIIENYIDSPNYIALINQYTEEIKQKEEEAARKEAKVPEIIEQRITEVLGAANKFTLDTFLRYLNIDEKFFFKNNQIWAQKFKYQLEGNIIIKTT